MIPKKTYLIFFFGLLCFFGNSQDLAYNDARALAYKGNHASAKDALIKILANKPQDIKSRALLASTYSWSGKYEKAREEFNKATSVEKSNTALWVSAIKNELYANENATAFGLSNKALRYLKSNSEVERLQQIAFDRINTANYPENAWHNTTASLTPTQDSYNTYKEEPKEEEEAKIEPEQIREGISNNRLAVRNAFTVFDQRYDPVIYSSVSFRRQTLAGSIIPRVNYSNRNGQNGIQYDLDFYPKFSKRFYAYLNYGFSNATIYPNHKMGGDLYVNLPHAIEFSAGGRHIRFQTRNIAVITNSLGHYSGNYYFSLRSYITPKPEGLTSFSGNLLVRKYLKDAENFYGFNIGLGFSPELRQLISGDELLAETLLFVQSQRLNLEYQFTQKNSQNAYRANLGVARQEFSFASNTYFWGVSAGLTYQVNF